MKRAALYARVSTEGQRDEATIESQIDELRRRIDNDGLPLAEERIYSDDGYSGELLARPALDRMRYDARKGQFEVLYVYDRGRLARKFAYQEILIEEFVDNEIEFVTLHDVKAETPEDHILQAMQGVFHEYERIKISERLRRGKIFRVQSGKLLGYCAKYGYDYHRSADGDDRRFEVNQRQAAVVCQIFHWIGDDGASLREVIRRLHIAGIPPAKGQRATWTTGPLARMLRDETYTGTHYYRKSESVLSKSDRNETGRYRRTKKTGRRERPRSDWMPIQVPAILSRELFDRVQQQLAVNAQCSPRNAKNHYLLQGLIYCPCGQRRTGEPNKGHPCYRCTDRQKQFPLPPRCRRPSVPSSVLDALVWDTVAGLIRQPELIRQQAVKWLDQQSDAGGVPDADESLEAEIRSLDLEEVRYAEAFGDGAISLPGLKTLTDRLRARRQTIVEKMAGQRSRSKQPTTSPEELAQLAIRSLRTLPMSNRKVVVQRLVRQVIADREQVVIRGLIPIGSDDVPRALDQPVPRRTLVLPPNDTWQDNSGAIDEGWLDQPSGDDSAASIDLGLRSGNNKSGHANSAVTKPGDVCTSPPRQRDDSCLEFDLVVSLPLPTRERNGSSSTADTEGGSPPPKSPRSTHPRA